VRSFLVAEFAAPGNDRQRADFHAVAAAAYPSGLASATPMPAVIERQVAVALREPRAFVGYREDRPVTRLVASASRVHQDDQGGALGLLSFVESLDDAEVAAATFDAAVRWLSAQGAGRIVGPLDGDTWHRYRVNVGPFERPRFPLEPWNPPYYQRLWERAGFTPLESYSSKWIADVGTLLPGLEQGLKRSRDRGIRIRGIDTTRIESELALVHRLSLEIFRDALLYTPIGRDEFLAMYAGMERLLDPELVLFAEDAAGTAVGFVFAYADLPQRAVHYKTIGVLAEWRRAAAAAALSHAVYSGALRKGLPNGNHALMRDDNRSQALDQGLGEIFRRYLLYERRP
jgi:hypothetical protein